MFERLDPHNCVIVRNGVSKMAPLYLGWDGRIYAAFSGGYIALKQDGTTSLDKANLTFMDFDGELHACAFGFLYREHNTKTKRIVQANPAGGLKLLSSQD